MPLVDAKKMLAVAEESGFPVCAFDVPEESLAAAALAAAADAASPVILGVDPGMDLERLLPGIEAAARRSPAPSALWCHGAGSAGQAVRAINLGCNGIDAGSGEAAAIASACGVAAAGRGMIRHENTLSRAAAACIRARPDVADYGVLMQRVREAVRNEAEGCLRSARSGGQADTVLAACPAWSNVEHCILYNVAADGEETAVAEALMAEGREILSAIPGVREVVTGRALTPDAQYRYCWLIRFAHPAVIESYRNHPDHVAFADARFRPVAGDRITIDFQRIE